MANIFTSPIRTGDEQGTQTEDVLARRKFLAENPELLYQYASNLLPLLLQVYHGTVVQQVQSLLIISGATKKLPSICGYAARSHVAGSGFRRVSLAGFWLRLIYKILHTDYHCIANQDDVLRHFCAGEGEGAVHHRQDHAVWPS